MLKDEIEKKKLIKEKDLEKKSKLTSQIHDSVHKTKIIL
jgi:hypothetical protein